MATIGGKKVGKTGYGLMGFTWRDNPISEDQSFEAMRTALKGGCNFWNGGEFYGPPHYNSLQLLNHYFKKYPEDADKVVISIKGGAGANFELDHTREGVRKSVDNCLRLLGDAKNLDIFECARVDQKTPIEVTIRALAEYVAEGKLRGISMSECAASTIRRAAKVHKIDAVEVEFSMFATEILDNGVAAACAENNIPIVAYSPLGRGFLTGQLKSPDDIPKGDFRRIMPRFQPGNFEKNLVLAHEAEAIAKKKGCTVGQVALAWVKAYGEKSGMPTIIPIPGATTAQRVQENAVEVTLTSEEMQELDEIVKKCEVHGNRYPDFTEHLNFGETPPETS